MDWLRFFGKFLGGLLFTFSLSLLIVCIAMSSMTEYNNAKSIFADVYVGALKSQISDAQLNEIFNAAINACQGKESINYVLGEENMTFNCTDIRGGNATTLPYLVATKSFDTFYYKNYNCSFIDCIKNISSPEDATVFFSSTGNEFFNKLLMYVIVATVLTGLIFLASIETWSGRFQSLGVEFLFIGIMYFLIPYAKDAAIKQFPQELLPLISRIIDIIFNSISSILLIFFVAGVVLIAISLGIKYLAKKKEEKSVK